MPDIFQLVQGLQDKNNTYAYACLKTLLTESQNGPEVYALWDIFAPWVGSPHSYVRTRAFLLMAANARWDTAGKLDAVLPQCLKCITDDKPITARQCIQALPEMAKAKPALVPAIRAALEAADLAKYPDTMAPLVAKDIAAALAAMQSR